MSRLSKEELIKLKEQFKSVQNVLPSRFIEEDDLQNKPNKSEDDPAGGDKSRQQSMINDREAVSSKNAIKKS